MNDAADQVQGSASEEVLLEGAIGMAPTSGAPLQGEVKCVDKLANDDILGEVVFDIVFHSCSESQCHSHQFSSH